MLKSNKKKRIIYLDYASASFPDGANPGAIHTLGVKEKNKFLQARADVAKVLGVHSDEIIFTSGATESNNLAILGLLHLTPALSLLARRSFSGVGLRRGGKQESELPHIITTNIEHASVLEVCRHLEREKKAEVSYVPVDENGIVSAEKIKKALRPNTVLVSVMYANNEIGTIQPIREIAKEVRHFNKINSKKIFFHTDAVQAVNYLPMGIPQLGVDLLSVNGAKIYGPKGIGVLFKKRGTPLSPMMFGGEQEFGLRPGTPNPDLALAFARALKESERVKEKEAKRLTKLRDYFLDKLDKLGKISFSQVLGSPGPHTPARPFQKEIFAKFVKNGDLKNRLPNNINITIPNIPSDLLVIELSERGVMASAKSACKAGDGKASHVIKAINKSIREQDGSLRFSMGRQTTKADIDYTIQALSEILTKLKIWYS